MKHIWTILCKRAILDRPTGNISLIDIIEELTVKDPQQSSEDEREKIINTNFSLVSYWRKNSSDQEEINLKIIEEAPNGKTLKSAEKRLSIPKDKDKLRIHFTFEELKVIDSGKYLIKVKRRTNQENYEMISEVPIDINIETE